VIAKLRSRPAGSVRLIDRHGRNGIPVVLNVPSPYAGPTMILERTVAHHLRIQAAVVGIVDLLGHQPIESRAHGVRWLIQLNVEVRLRRLCRANAGYDGGCQRQQRNLCAFTGALEISACKTLEFMPIFILRSQLPTYLESVY